MIILTWGTLHASYRSSVVAELPAKGGCAAGPDIFSNTVCVNRGEMILFLYARWESCLVGAGNPWT